MKISRREHLKKLGLGAAGTLGAGLFANDLAASQALTSVPNYISTLAPQRGLPARDWPWTSSKPSDENPGIRVIFAGLMLFTYKRSLLKGREGRVVFHRGAAHKLQIIVYRSKGCVKLTTIDVPEKAKIELEIKDRLYHDVTYYQTGNKNDYDRAQWDDKDFRWLLDLEGPEPFNNKDFDRTKDHGFDTMLEIQSGRFYTYQRTNSTFTADVGTLKDQVFKVAKVMACDLWTADEDTVLLKIDNKPIEVDGKPLEMGKPGQLRDLFSEWP